MLDKNLFSDIWNDQVLGDVANLKGPILIVGASGFIGAKLFYSLAARRTDVYATSSAIENSWRLNGYYGADKSKLINCDVTDKRSVDAVVRRLKPRTVFNLSAYGAYERQNQPEKIAQVNYLGVLNLILALEEVGCDAFVQAGSSSEYGLNCKAPSENGELLPNSDYAVSKGAASLLVSYYGKIKNFPCVNLRLYSIYGPWEDRNRLIPKLVESSLQGKLPPFADAKISRDFVYIDDCTYAFIKAALTVCRDEPGLSINIASGKATSLENVAGLAKEIFGIKQLPQFGSMTNRKWDLSNWYGDPSLAEKKMGWKANVDFKTGLELTASWERVAGSAVNFGYNPTKSKKISMIIACYKDNQAIPLMYKRIVETFKIIGYDYEIIFVNDRSPANDEEEIMKICQQDSRVIGITHSRNFGSQSAFVSGMEVSTGDAVVLMDGDLQDPPELIADFAKKWDEGYQIVYGVRIKREAKLYMQMLYKVFYRIFRNLSEIPIPVDAGDFSLIDRKAVDQLIKLPERDQFIRGLRAWIGFRQVGVSYHRPERAFGISTNNFSKNIWWAKKGIFSFSTKPLNYMQALGVGLFAISWVMIFYYIVNYFLNPHENPRGTNTIIILILALGGLQIFSVSILGDYIGKILEEVKGRPKFIRAKIINGNSVYEGPKEISQFMSSREPSQ